MRVGVAIHAFCEGDLVPRRRSSGNVALSAFHSNMFSFERVGGRGVRLYVEERGFPTIYIVAGRAFTLVRPLSKLASVRVRRVAVRATREGDGFLEISSEVAFQAIHLCVLAEQRKLCLGMVESLGLRDLFPSTGRVARFA